MPNIGSIGWAYVSGSAVGVGYTYNASTLEEDTDIPSGYYSLIYGPLTIDEGTTLTVKADAHVKIKDFTNV